MFLTVLVILLVTISGALGEEPLEVLSSILEKSSSKFATAFVCETEKDFQNIKALNRELVNLGGRMKVTNLDQDVDENIKDLLQFQPANGFLWLNFDCNASLAALDALSSQNLLNGSRKIVAYGSNFSETLEVGMRQSIKLDSEVLLTSPEGRIFRLSSIEARKGTRIEVNEVTGKYQDIVPPDRIDLEGYVIRVAFTLAFIPKGKILLDYLNTPDPHDHNDNLNRFYNSLVILFSERHNFRIQWLRSTSYGYQLPDKSWIGALKFVNEDRAVISTSGCLYMPFRAKITDSIFGGFPIRYLFLFIHPRKVISTDPFIRPISCGCWVMLGVTSAVAVIVLYLSFKKDSSSETLSTVGIFVLSILSNQGVAERSTWRRSRIRLVIISFMILSTILSQFYAATIVGFLLRKSPKTITDQEKFAKSDLKLVLEDIPTSSAYLKYFSIGREILQKKVSDPPIFVNSEQAVEYIRKGYAFFGNVDRPYDFIRKNFTSQEKDDLQEVPFKPNHVNIFIKKFSPFKEMFRASMLWVTETGLGDYLYKVWVPPPPKGSLDGSNVVEVDFHQVKSLIWFLFMGFVVSLVILAFEIIVFRIKRWETRVQVLN